MFVPPQPKAPASKTKTTVTAFIIIFLLYQVWSQSDKLTFEVVSHPGFLAGDQVVLSDTWESHDEGIPKKIWYKLGPKGLSAEMKEWTGSCIKQNPDYEHEFLTVRPSYQLERHESFNGEY